MASQCNEPLQRDLPRDLLPQNGSGATTLGRTTPPLEADLIRAVEAGTPDEVARLLASGANANASNSVGRSALSFAVARGCVPTVRALLAAGAKVNHGRPFVRSYLSTLIQNVAAHGTARVNELVRILLASGARLTSYDVCLAIDTDNVEAVKLLLGAGASPVIGLQHAVCNSRPKFVDFFIEAGTIATPDLVALAQSRGDEPIVQALTRRV